MSAHQAPQGHSGAKYWSHLHSDVNRWTVECADYRLENLRLARHLVSNGSLKADDSRTWREQDSPQHNQYPKGES